MRWTKGITSRHIALSVYRPLESRLLIGRSSVFEDVKNRIHKQQVRRQQENCGFRKWLCECRGRSHFASIVKLLQSRTLMRFNFSAEIMSTHNNPNF
nr:hypothetical transcript [Hymenolepis microstoma]